MFVPGERHGNHRSHAASTRKFHSREAAKTEVVPRSTRSKSRRAPKNSFGYRKRRRRATRHIAESARRARPRTRHPSANQRFRTTTLRRSSDAARPLRAPQCFLNSRLVGQLRRDISGATSFQYDPSWLEWEFVMPVSLSLPLREQAYSGAPVIAVFDNLLPDSDHLRRQIAARTHAEGTDRI